MQSTFKNLVVLFLALCFAGSALAQNDIFMTMDPVTSKPTLVAEPNPNSPMHFKSINYLAPASPEPFILRFQTDFIGKYSGGAGYNIPDGFCAGNLGKKPTPNKVE